ncbi:hypothetical protein EVAR_22709_1 [Eumeta japonica]|uniref:Uncharacterized protein n=1 Tax=Eumeta variegata TaxID=151549 RepID=A0A4C1UTH2_EUMVA|nr:hypothetical protein EVAR_22709_1 [Eumeta japonica]
MAARRGQPAPSRESVFPNGCTRKHTSPRVRRRTMGGEMKAPLLNIRDVISSNGRRARDNTRSAHDLYIKGEVGARRSLPEP